MRSLVLLSLVATAVGHGHHEQIPIQGPHPGLWFANKLPGDGGTQVR